MRRTSHVMNQTVSQKLNAANRRWKVLFFARLLGWWVTAFAGGAVVLALAIDRKWIHTSLEAGLWCGFLILLFLGGLGVIGLIGLIKRRPNSWLGLQIEKRFPTLLDRVNTMVFLERKPRDPTTDAYFGAIGLQAARELLPHSSGKAIPKGSTLLSFVVAVAACIGAYQFYVHFPPWDAFSERENGAKLSPADNAEELKLPEEDIAEGKKSWGEVRITEPGGDLKLTKVDVLPLTVEAASSQRLQTASWITAINGGAPFDHVLPKPAEPNYAVYQPTIYLDEMGVSDWDVLTYYARAATDNEDKYASEIYFVEIKPFREDLMKLEGSGGSGAANALKELGTLIRKQQEILRQTNRQKEKPSSNEAERKQDQGKLGTAEKDLGDATSHLYAKLAAMEHQDIGTVLDKLAGAQNRMETATNELNEPDNPSAMNEQQSALQQLVESRKDLVKAISNGFGKASGQGDDEEKPPTAEKFDGKGKLADIEDFRDEGKAAMNGLRAIREKEEAIAKVTAEAAPADLPALARQQADLRQELTDMQKKLPRPFEELDKASKQAQTSVDQAVGALARKSTGKVATTKAAEDLRALEKGLEEQAAVRSLTDVYRLKEMLDAHAGDLNEMQKKPGDVDAKDLARATAQAKSAKDAMAKTLEETPAGKSFGPGLEKALQGGPGKQLDQAAAQAQSSAGEPGKAAANALAGLNAIQDAFAASQPTLMHGNAAEAAKGGNNGSGVAEAMQRLNSLIQRAKDQRETKPEDLRKQLEEARLALLEDAEANKATGAPLLLAAENLAKMSGQVDLKVDPVALRKLVDSLEDYRIEVADHQRDKPDDPKLLHVDPSQVPVEFRERVRRYFEKLSNG